MSFTTVQNFSISASESLLSNAIVPKMDSWLAVSQPYDILQLYSLRNNLMRLTKDRIYKTVCA